MTFTDKINEDIKQAMLAREKEKLEALRAIKSALIIAATEKGASGDVSEEAGIKALQKLVKQRKEAADIYTAQNRKDLADVELFQSEIIEAYLPKQMSEDEVREALKKIIAELGAVTTADMGKVIGIAMKQLGAKADGKLVSGLVKQLLS